MTSSLRRRQKRSAGAQAQGRGKPAAKNQSPPVSARREAATWLSRYRHVPGWTPNPLTAFILLLAIRLAGALFNGIADCDETYNYWEPLHMLLHGSGMQTWEYSPDFAIRSYAFLLPYALAAKTGQAISVLLPAAQRLSQKLIQFYSARLAQAAVCALAEMSLYDACVFRFDAPSARVLLVFLASSAGIFRAATELLPSSFAMIMLMFATSHWMMGRFFLAVACVALAAELGWPFAALLALPMAMHIAYRRGLSPLLRFSALCGAGIAAIMVPVDSFYFGRPVVALLNILRYNVFPVEGAGPELYGTEPWTFYVTNLVLNCNIVPAIALSLPFLFAMHTVGASAYAHKVKPAAEMMSRLIFLSPAFLWLAVFFGQPHKEERFLAPVYPLLCLVAAVALCDWSILVYSDVPEASGLPSRRASTFFKSLRFFLSRAAPLLLCACAVAAGCSRVVMQIHSFSAPFRVFHDFGQLELRGGLGPRGAPQEMSSSASAVNVCMENEWYRFPSHFFLPGNAARLRFVRSGFRGLLPKPFDESADGTRSAPPGMNMFNREDPNQYVNDLLTDCHYFVTLNLRSRDASPGDPEVPLESENWLTLFSEKMVDLELSQAGFRSFWIPQQSVSRLVYGQFELLRNLKLLPILTGGGS